MAKVKSIVIEKAQNGWIVVTNALATKTFVYTDTAKMCMELFGLIDDGEPDPEPYVPSGVLVSVSPDIHEDPQ